MAWSLSTTFRLIPKMFGEARERGFWGTMAAIRLGRLGMYDCLVAEDELGNKYFENKACVYGRDRWVEYSTGTVNNQVDPCRVAPEWHAWLHHIVQESPLDDQLLKPVKYRGRVTANLTGSPVAYVSPHNPRSTHYVGPAISKIQEWEGGLQPVVKRGQEEEQDVLDLR